MVTWQVIFSRHAEKDAQKLASAGLKPRAQELLAVLANDPFQNSSFYEKPFGDLVGAYSWRINIQHRLIYEVFVKERTARLLRMWSHFRLKAALISNRAEHSPHQLPSDATCIAPGFSA